MKKNGFTLLELVVVIAIVSIAAGFGLPSFTQFLERNRVDNKLSELTRMLAYARGHAVSTETTVTVCPLNSSKACTNDWSKEIVAFSDVNFNGQLDDGEEELRVANAIESQDTLLYSHSSISYESTGMLADPFDGGTFRFCPRSITNGNSRSIIVTSHSGRVRYSDASTSCSSS